MDARQVYYGSNGAAIAFLYKTLEGLGPCGNVAMNLFRAQKCSSRAKVYHGGVPGRGSYRDLAYEKKQWSMDQLCSILQEHGIVLKVRWGWKLDPAQAFHKWVLYVELPTGQVSFHTERRGEGPDFDGDWDGQHSSEDRIIEWTAKVLAKGVQI